MDNELICEICELHGSLSLAWVGFIPFFGDGLKTLWKWAKHAEGVFKVAEESFQISWKKIEQLGKRGWNDLKIQDVLQNPLSTAKTIDKATWEEATAYFISTNQYIIRGDTSWKIIQGSDLNDHLWEVPKYFKY